MRKFNKDLPHVIAGPFRRPVSEGGMVHFAIAFPGAFTGFGDSEDEAAKMALMSLLSARSRAEKAGADVDAWWASMWSNMNPILEALLEHITPGPTINELLGTRVATYMGSPYERILRSDRGNLVSDCALAGAR